MSIKIFLTKRIGIDGAVAYSTGARIVQAFTGPISILFISRYLSGGEQGFYYTFGSILAIQTFFELGLNGIITQFVAHEACHLKRQPDNSYLGESKYQSRLASLLRWSVKWYSVISALFLVSLIVIGFVYFYTFGENEFDVNWQVPWILISIATAIKLFQSPITAILLGLNLVKEMNKLSFWQQLILPTTTWLSLLLGCKLYVLGISSLLSTLCWFAFIYKAKILQIILQLWNVEIIERINYVKEIFPMQWRIGLSWISGYFVFNIFNVVLFATDGPVMAGRMGMTLQILTAIQTMGLAWINTKVPVFSGLIAQKQYVELDTLFSKTIKQMMLVLTLAVSVFFGGVILLNLTQFRFGESYLYERLLPYLPLILMIASMLINDYVAAIATYLRCHKKEPFLWNSIVAGLLCGTSTIVFGHLFGVEGITIGYFVITFIMAIWGQWIYINCKKKWHT